MSGQTLPYDETEPTIGAFIKWAKANVDKFLWSEGHCYSEKYWIGGIGDGGYMTKDGKRISWNRGPRRMEELVEGGITSGMEDMPKI